MFVTTRTTSLLGQAWKLAAFAASLVTGLASSQPSLGQGTHLWTQSRLEEFEKGTPLGVELTSDGHLRQGSGLSEMLTTPST
jgi:hypothetical protein